MKLIPLMTYHATLGAALAVGPTMYGNRLIVEVEGGAFDGPRLRGVIRPLSGADWLTMTEDFAHLDVRVTFETDDGAFIYVEYTGRVELTAAVQSALAGQGNTEFGEAYFFTSPRMQCGDPRYRWVNNIICVGQGRFRDGRVEYQVFQVAND